MSMSDLTMFSMARRKMNWLGQRQTVLSQNIANADTPRYRAKELEGLNFRDALKKTGSLRVAETTTNHLKTIGERGDHQVDELRPREVYETNPDGNGVIMEEQMIKVAKNQMEYQLVSNIYKKHMRMLKMAVSAPGK